MTLSVCLCEEEEEEEGAPRVHNLLIKQHKSCMSGTPAEWTPPAQEGLIHLLCFMFQTCTWMDLLCFLMTSLNWSHSTVLAGIYMNTVPAYEKVVGNVSVCRFIRMIAQDLNVSTVKHESKCKRAHTYS